MANKQDPGKAGDEMILIEVCVGGRNIVFDADHPYPDCYFTYDREVLRRIWRTVRRVNVDEYRQDPAPKYLAALRKEFGNATLVGSTWQPGCVH